MKKQIFVSSYSAHKDAVSNYGKTKYQVEEYFRSLDHFEIIRPSLVIGDGGIFGRMKDWANKHSLIPLPDGGHHNIATIPVEDLALIIMDACETEPRRQVTNAETDTKTLRQIMLQESKLAGRVPVFVNVPARPLILLLDILHLFGFQFPVSADNVRGLVGNSNHYIANED